MSTEFSTELSELAPAQEGPSRGPRGINLTRLFRVRGPMVAIVFACLGVPATIATWFLTPLEYEATALIRFSAKTPTVMLEERDTASNRPIYDRFVATQVELITGNTVLEQVVDDPEAHNTPMLANLQRTDAVELLKKKVSAKIELNSELVSVTCRDARREVALTIASAVVRVFEAFITGQEKTKGGQIRSVLKTEEEELQADLEAQLTHIANLRKKIGATSADSSNARATETQSYRENLSRAKADVTTAETQIARGQASVAQVEELQKKCEASPGEPVFAFGVEDKVSQDTAVVTLRQQLVTAEQQMAVLRDRYVGEPPQLKTQQETRNSLLKQLDEARATARGAALASVLEQTRQQLETANVALKDAKAREEKFDALLQQDLQKASQVSEGLAEIQELERKADDGRQRLKEIRDRINQIDIESNAPASVDVPNRAVLASAPPGPDYGKRLQLAALALMMSALVAGGLGLFRELTDQEIRTAQDVASVTDLPILATVPDRSVDRLPSEVNIALLTAEHPESTMADQFRRVLTRILYPPEGSAELNTCLVTSPSTGDGKTSLACNLALSLAQAGRRVLLIDLSLRRPAVEARFGLERGPGLSEIMVVGELPDDVVRATPFSNLSVLGPGFEVEDLIRKLASRSMVEFLEKAEGAFDHVIIDTPPALLTSESKLLAPVVDGLILVVGARTSSVGMVRRCVSELRQIGANLIGIVLNGLRPQRGGYLRANLEQYYAYSDEPRSGAPQAGRAPAATGLEEEPDILLVDADVRDADEDVRGADEDVRGADEDVRGADKE